MRKLKKKEKKIHPCHPTHRHLTDASSNTLERKKKALIHNTQMQVQVYKPPVESIMPYLI